MSNSFQLSLAPHTLWQAINPWTFYQQGAQFGLINIDLGQTNHPDIEQKILDQVGSYGRQLGRMGDVLEILMNRLDRDSLPKEEQAAIDALRAQLEDVRKIKDRSLQTKHRKTDA
jgi:hypothetical protein